MERFWSKVDTSGGCWLWKASISNTGYGRFRYGGSSGYAHRYAYESLVGPIPEGLHIDHLCRTPLCVNPAHLEAVTCRENLLRGETLTARHAAQTHCKRGHEFTEANTYRQGGRRHCRTCKREAARIYRTRVAA